MSLPSLLLRFMLIASLLLNGAWSAFASVGMGAGQPSHANDMPVQSAPQSDEDCAAHSSATHHAAADTASEDGSENAHGDHSGPDCCKSSACQCACVHACASALPSHVYVSVQPVLGLGAMPLALGHPAPALPHLIRPPIC